MVNMVNTFENTKFIENRPIIKSLESANYCRRLGHREQKKKNNFSRLFLIFSKLYSYIVL